MYCMEDEQNKKCRRQIRTSAMNMLAAREHSCVELRQKLVRKMANTITQANIDELIDDVLQQLLTDNLLNEQRFAQSFIRSRINKGSGPVKIRHELLARGISTELADDYLDDSYEFWQQHIKAVRSKRYGLNHPKSYKERAKQSRFLYQRGFSGEFIRRLFNEI